MKGRIFVSHVDLFSVEEIEFFEVQNKLMITI
jgi:hypothetical protein